MTGVARIFEGLRGSIRQLLNSGVRPNAEQRLPDWKALLATNASLWTGSKARSGVKPRILIATNVGGHSPVCVMESTLVAALTLRGADVHVVLCDGVLPGCLKATIFAVPDPGTLVRYELPKVACAGCHGQGEAVYRWFGVTVHRLGGLLTPEMRNQAKRLADSLSSVELQSYKFDGMAIGEHAYAGALRYYARGNLDAEPQGEVVLRRYFEAAMLTALSYRRLFGDIRFDAACFHHGLYVPQGVVGEACRATGIRVVNWAVAYRSKSFIFSHGDTYHHTLISEPADAWREMPWDAIQERQIMDYLASRWKGTRDWIYFHEKPDDDFVRSAQELGIDLRKPIIGMLTNVMWDAQLHYPANAFPNMLAWVLGTIGYFARRPDLQLLIRVHPAEIRGTLKSRQPLVEEIRKAFPTLPANVFVVPPDSPVSTYAAMASCNAALIYGTKTGVELSSVGLPVIVAGEAWIRNKGLTRDAASQEHYYRLLDELPVQPMPDEQTRQARKYAFHFFFRRMIPIRFMEPNKVSSAFDVRIESLDELLPGRDTGLDVICDGILKGSPFIYPAEKLGLHDA